MSQTNNKNNNKKIIIWSSVIATIVLLLLSYTYYKLTQNPTPPAVKESVLKTKEEKEPETEGQYQKALKKWQDQCLIKPVETDKDEGYTSDDLRDNILGRYNRVLYDKAGNKHEYKYNKGLLSDSWYLNDSILGLTETSKNKVPPRNKLDYLDTTPPPVRPKNMPSEDYHLKHTSIVYNDEGQPKIAIDFYIKNKFKSQRIDYYDTGIKKSVTKHNPQTNKPIAHTSYNPDGSIKEIKYY
ncbi:hypothetical protein [Candidatus Phytoplasma pruni]|uniref:DUF2963 domain-containing protein n=1 Tax=Candidatus Phytoplasma pruni TaxID=479893 RepID=A0A851HIS1_9MOLU|nr:hypothetical protein [Candidatus Phytoplasma pruni]NWN45723.1 hypothetical protein [Candidatus Phytoplasma pruni]